MAFSEKLKNEIQLYCTNHLPPDSWYENEFSFIQDIELKNRIIAEFKAIRFTSLDKGTQPFVVCDG